jgi:hypothetical protein
MLHTVCWTERIFMLHTVCLQKRMLSDMIGSNDFACKVHMRKISGRPWKVSEVKKNDKTMKILQWRYALKCIASHVAAFTRSMANCLVDSLNKILWYSTEGTSFTLICSFHGCMRYVNRSLFDLATYKFVESPYPCIELCHFHFCPGVIHELKA